MSRCRPRSLQVGDVLGQVAAILEEPLHSLSRSPAVFCITSISRISHGEERNDADHRADPEGHASCPFARAAGRSRTRPPRPRARCRRGVHRVDDGDEVLEELRGHVLVGGIFSGQLERHGEHGRAVERHPGGAVRLFELAAGRKRLASDRRRRCCRDREIRRRRGSCRRASLRFTHQVKLRSSFWNARARKTRSRCPRGPVIL